MAPLDLTLSDIEMSNSRSLGFWSLVFRKGAYLGPMLVLIINKKPYMESPMVPSHLILKGQSQGHSDFEALYIVNELGPILVLTINRKSNIGSPMTSWYLTLSDLEGSKSLRFRSPIYSKRAELGLMLLLNMNRKPYMGSQTDLSNLTLSDLERSMSRSLWFQSLILVSHKGA